MSIERQKAIAQRYRFEYVGGGDLTVADAVLPSWFGWNGERTHRESHKGVVTMWHKAFPDLHFVIEDMIAERDRVVERFTARGTHEGEWFGIPATGKRVEVAGILIHRIVSEKTEEIWEILDAFSLLEQLGVALPVGQNDE